MFQFTISRSDVLKNYVLSINIVPEITLTPRSIIVLENTGEVQICISIDSPIARNVIVTANTGPKSGAVNQATGAKQT